MLAKMMMLPAGAQTGGQAEMRVTQTGAQTGGTAELRVVVPQTGGKAKAILELAFGGIHFAKSGGKCPRWHRAKIKAKQMDSHGSDLYLQHFMSKYKCPTSAAEDAETRFVESYLQ